MIQCKLPLSVNALSLKQLVEKKGWTFYPVGTYIYRTYSMAGMTFTDYDEHIKTLKLNLHRVMGFNVNSKGDGIYSLRTYYQPRLGWESSLGWMPIFKSAFFAECDEWTVASPEMITLYKLGRSEI
jgi:hypothetical protein